MQNPTKVIQERNEEQIRPNRSGLLRFIFLVVGVLTTVLGLIGIILPVLPTTPFLLVAAACFARSSEKWYLWLLSNRYFGKYIVAWRRERRIPLHAKVLAVAMIVGSIGASIFWFVPLLAVKILLAVIGVGVIGYICHFPN